jgi:hypothetical protein
MIEAIVSALFWYLLVLPFATTWSLFYLGRLVHDAVQPPILLVLLTINAAVVLVCTTYFGALIVNARFLGHQNPPELLLSTLLALDLPLTMINVIAVVLWRHNGGRRRIGADD